MLFIFLFVAVSTGMADSSLDHVLAESRFSTEERYEIEQMFASANQSGIDTETLLPRLQEAKAKNVSAKRLILALTREIERLEAARDILIEVENGKAMVFNDAGWQRTANLIAWGASKTEIQALAGACEGDVTVYLEASYLFTSLVEWGLERSISARLVTAVSHSAIETDEYPGIFEILINGRRLKMQLPYIAERMIELLGDVESIGQLQRQVLNGL